MRAVQGDLGISKRWRRDRRGENLDVYLRLTQKIVEAGRPELVIWPEAASDALKDRFGPSTVRAFRLFLRGSEIALESGATQAHRVLARKL